MLRRIRWIAYGVVIAALLALGGLWLRQSGIDIAGLGTSAAGVPGGVTVGGPFALTDDHGRAVTDASYRGHWLLVYFGYTYCPDVCPTELQTIAAALDKLWEQLAFVLRLDTPDPAAAWTERMVSSRSS